jgi:nitroreductase
VAPAAIVVTAVDARTIERYGQRGESRYVPMEAGHVGENLYLQAETRGLATVAVGAFRDDAVRSVLDLPDDHRPLYVFPVGPRRDTR